MRNRTMWQVVLGAVLLVGATQTFAAACTGVSPFEDVEQSDFFCTDTEWLRNRGITLGCDTDLYCPNDSVLRSQMAAFLNRLSVALTPVMQANDDQGGSVDVDADPVVCTLPTITPATYPRQALVLGGFSGRFNAAGAAQVRLRYNTDGSDTFPSFVSGNNGRVASAAEGWGSGTSIDSIDLLAGTTYRFAIDLSRAEGSGDLTNYRCQFVVMIMNRNGSASPFDLRAIPGDNPR